MKQILFIACIIFLSVQSKAQTKYSTPSDEYVNFHKLISTAERMYKNDSLLQAYAKFDIAFNSYQGAVNPGHYFRAALCALKIKEDYKSLAFLEKAIINGYEPDSITKTNIKFNNQNTIKEFNANYPLWEEKRNANRKAEFTTIIEDAATSNKKYKGSNYTTAVDFCSKCLANPKCNKSLPDFTSKYRMVKEKIKADSAAAVTIISNISSYGFPGTNVVSKKASDLACEMLLNYDADKTNSRTDAILFKALNDGHISPAFYTKLIDRRNVMNGSKPEFYEPVFGFEKLPAKDVTEANKSREKFGLPGLVIPSPAVLKTLNPKDTKGISKAYMIIYDY
jgi:hypothetical protein